MQARLLSCFCLAESLHPFMVHDLLIGNGATHGGMSHPTSVTIRRSCLLPCDHRPTQCRWGFFLVCVKLTIEIGREKQGMEELSARYTSCLSAEGLPVWYHWVQVYCKTMSYSPPTPHPGTRCMCNTLSLLSKQIKILTDRKWYIPGWRNGSVVKSSLTAFAGTSSVSSTHAIWLAAPRFTTVAPECRSCVCLPTYRHIHICKITNYDLYPPDEKSNPMRSLDPLHLFLIYHIPFSLAYGCITQPNSSCCGNWWPSRHQRQWTFSRPCYTWLHNGTWCYLFATPSLKCLVICLQAHNTLWELHLVWFIFSYLGPKVL